MIYNWGDVSGNGGSKTEFVDMNYVANWLHKGPATFDQIDIAFETRTPDPAFNRNHRIYQTGNLINDLNTGWDMFTNAYTKMDDPFKMASVQTDGVLVARGRVLADAGATLPKRDSIDKRIVNQVINLEGDIIDSQTEVGGWPVLSSTPAPNDTDHDGMPDSWERRYGLDESDPSDGAQDLDGDGYTNLEEYLNRLVYLAL